MTSRSFYRTAIVAPLVGLGIAALLDRSSSDLPAGWDWIYPASLTRGLLVYTVLTGWMWVELDRRTSEDFERLVWWVPLVYVVLGWLLMLTLSLLRGSAGDLWAEHSRTILLRTAVHLSIGYGYVILIRIALDRLRRGGEIADPT